MFGPVPSRRLGSADILPLISRRPLTVEEISALLGLHRNEVAKYLRELIEEGKIVETMYAGKRYFAVKVSQISS
ncbi:MAG: helix-turn-helix domain-containing protein [Euryarchaeota archaeon]|nr:helix-turn-helix domain-containing protein [Euryarchaeota archaeon]